MSTCYAAYHFTVQPAQPFTDILLAELSDFPFESFEENETGLIAYLPERNGDIEDLKQLPIFKNPAVSIAFKTFSISPQNWNANWEKEFQPVIVNDQCRIRASFHKAEEYPLEIVINPKMSFGTGHHETTALMLRHLLEMTCTDLKILDMGCGTGVLGIASLGLGAASVLAIDIEPWCIENTLENAELNNCELTVLEQSFVPLDQGLFDLVIANINRNILLEQMESYAKINAEGGTILVSGFYQKDLALIRAQMTKLGYELHIKYQENDWVAARFHKFS